MISIVHNFDHTASMVNLLNHKDLPTLFKLADLFRDYWFNF